MSSENATKAGIFLNHCFGGLTVARTTLVLLVVLFFPTNRTLGVQPSSDAPSGGTLGSKANTTNLVNNLFSALQSDDRTFPPAIEELLADANPTSKEDPNWPTIKYLLAEAYLRQNNTERARAAFRELTMWAVSNDSAGPYGDRWGGSGLAAIGLWRWLQILDENGASDPNEIDQVLESAEQLQNTRLFSGMVAARFLPALPLVE